MMITLTDLAQWNVVTILLLFIAAVSVWLGVGRGASGSMRHLLFIVAEAFFSLLALFVAYKATLWLMPILGDWLQSLHIQIPNHELAWWEKIYYPAVTGIRDLPLLRFAALLLVIYMIIRPLVQIVAFMIYAAIGIYDKGGSASPTGMRVESSKSSVEQLFSRLVGAIVGGIIGIVRVVMFAIILYVFVTAMPNSVVTKHIQASNLYSFLANRIIEPIAGPMVTKQLPVFTEQVSQQLRELMQRKYEVLDNHIPDDIKLATLEITKHATTDEEKARLLYDWVGSRVSYDWDKANRYIEDGIWKEQTPEVTFKTREGVCIDYARLYAMMAREVGLEVRVVTGRGYDGKGGYGPHAWNTVRIEGEKWIPLDATWASTGDWFNPPQFDATHIPDPI